MLRLRAIVLLFMIFSCIVAVSLFLLSFQDSAKVRQNESPKEKRLFAQGKSAEAAGDIKSAERVYLKLSEKFPAAFDDLAKLSFAQSRYFEARRYALKSLKHEPANYESLLISSGLQDTSLIHSSLRNAPEIDLIAEAKRLIASGQYHFAGDLLKHFLVQHPRHFQAQGWMGQILARQGLNEFASWNESLPKGATEHPAIWHARGLAAQHNDNSTLAINCFLKSLTLNPISLVDAEQFADEVKRVQPETELWFTSKNYVQKLRENSNLLQSLSKVKDFELMKKVADNFRGIGQIDLGNQWARKASELGCQANWVKIKHDSKGAQTVLKQIQEKWKLDSEQSAPAEVDWSRYSFRQESSAIQSSVQLKNVAREVGINFQYENGSPSETPISHLIETTGGGIGVIDFDLDGWPDLYLSQGGNWREQGILERQSNKLYRNQLGISANDVTELAMLESFDYSQGVCVGDYNNDGFSDIYVCQIKGNLLFENQGDGTFLNVTKESNTAGDQWSLSAAYADFNQDGFSDLYVVNYLDQSAVRNTPCFTNEIQRACPPSQFSGARDQLYLNDGTGQFQEIGQLAGIADVAGKGMGIIVADFDNSGSIEIFIGNDGEKNFLFESLKESRGGLIKLEDQAVLKGLATDAQGKPQATMGIAAADINDDGLLDLLVSNFYMETNTSYVQNQSRLFTDQTLASGALRETSLQMLGFGMQFFDPDLDGDHDLILANGHVDQTLVTGEPDEMLPQLFLNQGSADFQLFLPEKHGGYFQRPAFGRAVAKLDWDRDGREDICVTHLDQPVALLQNVSDIKGHSLALKLIGKDGEREPIGVSAKVRCGKKTWEQQLTSGDGYLVSNGKRLLFGLGVHDSVDELVVRWRSGEQQTFQNVSADHQYICIEGREALIPIH